MGIRQFPTNLHPLFEPTVAKQFIIDMVSRPLTAHDPQSKSVCLVCIGEPVLESVSPPIVRLKLDPRARWSDGHPVTTKDLLFTWTVAQRHESGVANFSFFKNISHVEVVDDWTARLHLQRLSFAYRNLNDFQLLPEHVEGPIFERDPPTYRNNSIYVRQPTASGLYLGPYIVENFLADSHIVLHRNPHWWGRPPAIEQITIRLIADTSALVANLLSGDIDMIPGEGGIAVDQAAVIERRYPGRFTFLYQPGLVFEHIDLNLDHEVVRDLRVRRALSLAIDRNSIVRAIFEDKYKVAQSFLSPLHPDVAQDLSTLYDPSKAKQLLADAGWRVGADDLRHDANGRPMVLEIVSTAGNRSREQVLQALQSQWRQIGIDVRIKLIASRTLFGEVLPHRTNWSMALYSYVLSPDWVPRTIFKSDQIPTEETRWTGFNFPGLRDFQVDRLIDRIDGEFDDAKRHDLWGQLQAQIASKLPVLPLYFSSDVYVMPPWLKGVTPTGHSSYSSLWVEDWH